MSFENYKLKKYVNGRSCAVLGLGVSNLPTAKMLSSFGVSLSVYDKKAPEEIGAEAMALKEAGVRFFCGEGCFDNVEEELIVRSPGIRPDIDGILRAKARGAEITGEIELLLALTDASVYAVTGSDGKTTTTTLTGMFLNEEKKRRNAGRVYVGGNIGTPLLPLCSEMSEKDTAVLELSSFQLMTVSRAPRYCAITNLSPNHLDWHKGGMSEYESAKRNIIGKETERVVLNAESEATARIAAEELEKAEREIIIFSSKRTATEITDFCGTNGAKKGLLRIICEKDGYITLFKPESPESGKRLLRTSDILLAGRHNVENYMTAIALTYGHVDVEIYTEIAKSFAGVEHRLQLVRTLDGVDYYNSSIDSSPSRTAAALSALHGRDIVIICGGYDKKIPFEPLAISLCKSVRACVLTGATGEKIRASVEACEAYGDSGLTLVSEPDFKRAVIKARELAREGGCVLLSPACASFDAFKNFAERGIRFCEIVNGF